MQHPDPTAVTDSHHTAARTGRLQLARLHRQHTPLQIVDFDVENVHANKNEDRIGQGTPARTRATHKVRHRRVLRNSVAWSLLILKDPASSLLDQHADPRSAINPCSDPKSPFTRLTPRPHRLRSHSPLSQQRSGRPFCLLLDLRSGEPEKSHNHHKPARRLQQRPAQHDELIHRQDRHQQSDETSRPVQQQVSIHPASIPTQSAARPRLLRTGRQSHTTRPGPALTGS